MMLAQVGFPLVETLGEHRVKRWKIDRETGLTQLSFTLDEATALYLGRQFLEPLAGTLFHTGARGAFQKIRATLGDAALRHLEKLAAGFYCAQQGWTDYSSKAELIDQLAIAIEERRLTVITYQSLRTTEPVTLYDVYPYALVFHRSALYLIAWSLDHDQIRTFKTDRLSAVEVHGLQFPAPKDFSPERHLEHSFGIFEGKGEPTCVRVAFRAKVVRILEERRFHHSQKLTPHPDGSVIAEFSISTFEEFLSWVMSFGAEAEVLEPISLRKQLAEMLQAVSARYTQSFVERPTATPQQVESRSTRRPR
jgi:proteasome accessory factor B